MLVKNTVFRVRYICVTILAVIGKRVAFQEESNANPQNLDRLGYLAKGLKVSDEILVASPLILQ